MAFHTSVAYIARDALFSREKAFSVDFPLEAHSDARATNHVFHRKEILVRELHHDDKFKLDTHGFCITKAETSLDPVLALEDIKLIEEAYIDELKALLKQRLPHYSRFECLDVIVRQRHPDFPNVGSSSIAHEQPAALPHSDFSQDGALLQLKYSFPGQEAYFEGRDYDLLNVWRPLFGPNNDWPLALCDYQSVSVEKDVCMNDAVHKDRVGENALLHPNESHQWYYKPNQTIRDVLIFRNASSTNSRAFCFHCAVFNPQAKGKPRCSIEARFVAFRD